MKRWIACAALLLAANTAHAQGIGINTTGAAADTSAILDLTTTAKGFLPPRMTSTQRAAIALPATGLVVYQTDGTTGLYVNVGTPAAPNWTAVSTGGGGSSQWTTSGANIYYSAGNVGIQRTAPAARLDILGGNWDVVGGEGDFRIGDASTRLKIGLATGGGGTGAATIMEQGPIGAYNVLSLGTQGNKVLHVNGNTQRVGIGIDLPTAPLGFAASLGKKISLFPSGTSDYGFGVASSRLQVFSDGTPGGDVAIGTDAAGSFIERFAVKNNGALAVNGNTGTTGQVLQSNGNGASATWVNPTSVTYNNCYTFAGTSALNVPANATWTQIPGLSAVITLAGNARVIVATEALYAPPFCAFCGGTDVTTGLFVGGGAVRMWYTHVDSGQLHTENSQYILTLGSGTYTFDVRIRTNGDSMDVGGSDPAFHNHLDIQVVPQ